MGSAGGDQSERDPVQLLQTCHSVGLAGLGANENTGGCLFKTYKELQGGYSRA